MKPNRITYTVLLFVLFGITAAAPCLPLQQGEKHKSDQGEQSKRKQADPQQQKPQQSHLRSQQPRQANSLPPAKGPDQQFQRVDRGRHEQTQQRRPTRDRSENPSGSNRLQDPNVRNQNGEQPQDLDKNRSTSPIDLQRTRQGGDNRDERVLESPGNRQGDRRNHASDWQGRRARDWRSDHRTWEQRGGYHGYRIPEYRFGRYFGQGHLFRIHDLPVIVTGGYPRFLYGGYWFSLLDPWPEYWTADWYETDDVYVVYGGDGYYLYNRRYPSVGIAVSISM